MKEVKQKFFLLVLSTVTVSLLVSISRQLIIHYRLNRQLASKKEEAKQLLERNKALEKSLRQAQGQKFLDEQARKLLGMSNPVVIQEEETADLEENTEVKEQLKKPNYRKWLKLFMY